VNPEPDDIVKVYSGPLVVVEAYQQVLREAGIESRVLGTALTASIGSAIPDSIELWVHQGQAENAVAAIKMYEEQRGEHQHHHEHHPHPTNSPKPGAAPWRKEPYTNPDPGGD
jgi:hypothetical protein